MTNIDTKTAHVQLPSLTVTGYRALESVTINRLGSVNLITGQSGSGKTSLLECIRLYADGRKSGTLRDILRARDAFNVERDEGVGGDSVISVDREALFHDVEAQEASFTVGPAGPEGKRMRVEAVTLERVLEVRKSLRLDRKWEQIYASTEPLSDREIEAVLFTQGTELFYMPLVFLSRDLAALQQTGVTESATDSVGLPVEYLGTGLVENKKFSKLWDRAVLTTDEDKALSAVNTVTGSDTQVERAVVTSWQRPLVKLRGRQRPLPLRGLGDGAVRAMTVALALASSKGGLVLLDEAGSGIHHGAQQDYWHNVITQSMENGTQVFASTSSRDCVNGFVRALAELPEADCVLVELEKARGKVAAREVAVETGQVVASADEVLARCAAPGP